ncbi:MAG: phosphoribosylanthranilate isomerase [Chloroflexi bacterium]|nr:phosphoribosylanthranilate isomerase [Chloroflexota bacterium]
MTLVKICGLSKVADALAAASAGADFLGIMFDPHSRRRVDVDNAKTLVQSFRARWPQKEPKWVGVFANQPIEEINHLLTYCDLDLAQLSGHESPEYCLQVVRPVVKVIHVRNDSPAQVVLEEVRRSLTMYQEGGHMCMLDTFKQGALGGTGQVFDWAVAQELAQEHSFLLAGGLVPENVSEAMRRVKPWGLDVSSGVETDGQKDANKIVQFIVQVRRTDDALKDISRT